jgi:sugar phosphate isomerase/epimerase
VHGTFGCVEPGAISESADERRHTLDRELELLHMAAAYAPCPYVIHYLNRYNDPAVAKRWRDSVQELLVHAAALQLTLAVETVPFKPEENERYADTAEVAAFVRAFDSEYLRMCVDVNHSNLHEDLGQAIRNCSGQIADIHISDNHGVREEHLQPGEGVIDMPFALAALREAGYSGPCNLECVPGGLTVESLSALRVAAEELVAKSMSVL